MDRPPQPAASQTPKARSPSVGERLDAFDVVQARLEAAISRLEDRMAAESRGLRPERGLRIVVGLLGVLSLASLLLGLRSLLS
jgi:hypothetical protein